MAKVRPDFLNVDDVTLTRLHLDPENPRHDPIQDEDRIIAQLFGAEKTLAVAKDIAHKGAISPLDRIGVIEMDDNPGHYIVVEGNRRTCALNVEFRRSLTRDFHRILTHPLCEPEGFTVWISA